MFSLPRFFSPNARRSVPLTELFLRFVPYTLNYRTRALLTGLFVVVSPIAAAGVLWSFKLIVDEVMIAGRLEMLPVFGAFYAALAALKIAVEYFTTKFEAGIVEDIGRDLRTGLYSHLMSLAPGSLRDKTPGDILARMSGDVERTEYLIYTCPLAIAADAAAAFFFTAFLFYLSPLLALATCAVLPLFLWLSTGLSRPIRRAAHLARRATARWMSFGEERIDALPIINAFGAAERETELLRRRCNRSRDAEVKSRVLLAWQTAGIELVAAFGALIVLSTGAYLIKAGTLSVGGLGAFIGAVWSAYAPIKALAKASGRMEHAAAGAVRIAELFDLKSLVTEISQAKPLALKRGRLSFEGVRYSYLQGPEVLHGIDLEVEPGETLAIVGPSGSGKSSLMRLALRHADPTHGRVLIDGQDIRSVTLSSVRRAIAPVFQDPSILSGTLASNIRFGEPGLTRQQIEDAARDASVDVFAETSRGGLGRATGYRGARLSGGQRQRVALARALAVNTPILVLDEATAAVDSETEELIQDALERLAGKRTLVVVAHRLSSIRRADKVVVIEDGCIVEAGRPDVLLAGQTRCRSLFATQILPIEAAA